LPEVSKIMFDISGFVAGSAAVALTGAALGWSLRPIFLRYRRAVVVAAAVLAAAGAAAYDVYDTKLAAEQPSPRVVREVPPEVTPSPSPGATSATSSEAWADYLEHAGRNAFVEGDYDAASRYWQDASRLSPHRAADLAAAIAQAQALAIDRL
jgi:hypothetical protein